MVAHGYCVEWSLCKGRRSGLEEEAWGGWEGREGKHWMDGGNGAGCVGVDPRATHTYFFVEKITKIPGQPQYTSMRS